MVVIGAALVAGGLLPFAGGEVAAVGLALAWLAVRRDRRVWRVLLAGGLAIAVGGVRAALAVRAHEAAMARAAVVPRTVALRGDGSGGRLAGRDARRAPMGRDARAAECEGVAWTGGSRSSAGRAAIARGDDVDVIAQLAPPTRLWNDGDPRPREARQGSERSGGAVDARIVRRGMGLLASIDRARAAARVRIDATFPADVAPMARALVLGESDLSPDDDAAMRASGLAHLLAVSGMHLVIAVVAAVAGLRASSRMALLAARTRRRALAAAVGIPLAWAYAELAGTAARRGERRGC